MGLTDFEVDLIIVLVYAIAAWLLTIWGGNIPDQEGRIIMSSRITFRIYRFIAFMLIDLFVRAGEGFILLIILLVLEWLIEQFFMRGCRSSCCGRTSGNTVDRRQYRDDNRSAMERTCDNDVCGNIGDQRFISYFWIRNCIDFVVALLGLAFGEFVLKYCIISDGVNVGLDNSSAWVFWITAFIVWILLVIIYRPLVIHVASTQQRNVLLDFRIAHVYAFTYLLILGLISGVSPGIGVIVVILFLVMDWILGFFVPTTGECFSWMKALLDLLFGIIAIWLGDFVLRAGLECMRHPIMI
jgi:hypothetical protein